MQSIGRLGVRVSSKKLLRRLESKLIIEEPPEDARPTLPSQRAWGGRRGYCYVTPRTEIEAFSFEGNDYRFVTKSDLTYIYKICTSTNTQT